MLSLSLSSSSALQLPPCLQKSRQHISTLLATGNCQFLFLAGYMLLLITILFPIFDCLHSLSPTQDLSFPDATVPVTQGLAAYLNYRQHCSQPRLAPLQKEIRKTITHTYMHTGNSTHHLFPARQLGTQPPTRV